MSSAHVALGLWPIAGITTIGVTASDAEKTIMTAIDSGITTFDTAFSYGYEGQSDRLLGLHLKKDRERFSVIGKTGQRWNSRRERIVDGSKARLVADTELSLERLGIERFDLLMLHSPDPIIPIETSAEAIADLQQRGLCSEAGVCNINVDQLQRFQSIVRCEAIQCPLNLLQRASLEHLIPYCETAQIRTYAFWTLMKGLLAGRIQRDHQFQPGDSRPSYPIFQGSARERAHRIVDGMNALAEEFQQTTAQLAIGWVLSQPGISMALVGGHTPEQIRETALARPLAPDQTKAIDRLVANTGTLE
jgi:aryl-alcohol dehydrogenase-like predicted oxidoreductase